MLRMKWKNIDTLTEVFVGKKEKKKPVQKDDLDMDMAKCMKVTCLYFDDGVCDSVYCHDADWYEAGKGPNPELSALDEELDSYLANKSVTEKQEVTE